MLVQTMMSGYYFLKSSCADVVVLLTKVKERLRVQTAMSLSPPAVFQTRGPATVNARSPTVERLTSDH